MGCIPEKATLLIEDIMFHSPLGVHIYELSDGELYFNGFNPAADTILGIDHSEFLGVKIVEAFPNVGTIKDEYISVIIDGVPWSDRHVDYEDDNVGGVFSVYAFKISPNRLATTFEDITEKVKMENKLKDSEERFKLLSEANFEGIAITRDGIILDINEQFADMIGCTTEEVVGKHVTDYVAPDFRELVINNLSNQYEDPYEHIAQRKDGSHFPVEIHGRTLANGLRLTAVRDMTRYKESEKALRQSEEKYRELVEATGAAIYEIDFVTRKFTYVNDVMCKLTGWSKEELFELGPEDFLTKNGLAEFAQRLENLKLGEHISDTHEYEIRVKDGSMKWTLITAIFKEDIEKNIIGASVVAIDITEKKLAQIEAEQKEEIIFSHLEEKIREWRKEITLKSIATEAKLNAISSNINAINNSEVYQQ